MDETTSVKQELMRSLERLKCARLRVDRSGSDAERDEALRGYDFAIRDFRNATGLIRATDDELNSFAAVRVHKSLTVCTRPECTEPALECSRSELCIRREILPSRVNSRV